MHLPVVLSKRDHSMDVQGRGLYKPILILPLPIDVCPGALREHVERCFLQFSGCVFPSPHLLPQVALDRHLEGLLHESQILGL